MISSPSFFAETEKSLNATYRFIAECRRCGQRWRVSMSGATLKCEKQKAWRELLHKPGADLNDDNVLRHLIAGVLPHHVCQPQVVRGCFPPEASGAMPEEPQPAVDEPDILSLIVQAVAEAERRGDRFTIRAFCRAYQGLADHGRIKLQKAVADGIAGGKLRLVQGKNGSGLGVKYLALAL